MANLKRKLKTNVDSRFFVDETCIDCDACRKHAPNVFGQAEGYAFVKENPKDPAEIVSAQKALLSCPVGAIGDEEKGNLLNAKEDLPYLLDGSVFINGFNPKSSFGADSYFIKTDSGNWLVDSPSFNSHLVKKFKSMGGIKYIFLTHRDDVADCEKYAKEFSAEMIIHEEDADSVPSAQIVLKGEGPFDFDEGHIVFTPGHTKGHCCLIWNKKYLFTGDHFSWSKRFSRYNVFKDFCWYDFDTLLDSVEKLGNYPEIEWILPGHGGRKKISEKNFKVVIDKFFEEKFWEK